MKSATHVILSTEERMCIIRHFAKLIIKSKETEKHRLFEYAIEYMLNNSILTKYEDKILIPISKRSVIRYTEENLTKMISDDIKNIAEEIVESEKEKIDQEQKEHP